MKEKNPQVSQVCWTTLKVENLKVFWIVEYRFRGQILSKLNIFEIVIDVLKNIII